MVGGYPLPFRVKPELAMKIVVLSGSPKGTLSFTLQYVFYLQKVFPEHEFHIVEIVK